MPLDLVGRSAERLSLCLPAQVPFLQDELKCEDAARLPKGCAAQLIASRLSLEALQASLDAAGGLRRGCECCPDRLAPGGRSKLA